MTQDRSWQIHLEEFGRVSDWKVAQTFAVIACVTDVERLGEWNALYLPFSLEPEFPFSLPFLLLPHRLKLLSEDVLPISQKVYKPKWPIYQASSYFHSIKRLGVSLLPLDGMLVHRSNPPPLQHFRLVALTIRCMVPLYTPGCPRTQHSDPGQRLNPDIRPPCLKRLTFFHSEIRDKIQTSVKHEELYTGSQNVKIIFVIFKSAFAWRQLYQP